MKKLICLLLSVAFLSGVSACSKEQEGALSETEPAATGSASVSENSYEKYLEMADPQYAYDIAYELSTNPEFFNSKLGGRTSGSEAEHRAAEYLVGKMEELGLEDIEKAAADCDVWQFNGATFIVDGKEYDVYSYATAGTEEITAELLFMGEGTMADYEGVDVIGKIVLVDIDMRANWWITYPLLEAEFQGAAAILSANVGGFSQIADDALNSQDICAPVSIPCLSIGLADSKEIQAKLEEGPLSATLEVDNVVEINEGTTYNVTGVLKGKSSEYQIIVGGHYDVHFWGFQDDNCAVGLVLAMAKGMIDSGYQPEYDIIFCLHGAEEWGSSNTQYDWTVGAWEMIHTVHPEWAGKTLAFINFELPAYEFDTYTSTYSAPEMYSMLRYFANEFPYAPKPEGCFPDGVLTEGYQTYTYSDDFSYYVAGVPSTVNGFLLQRDMETVFPFYEEIYHSQYDTPDTYNEAVMAFNLRYYGALAMYIDQAPALYLDFNAQYDRILESMDTDTMIAAGVDVDAYTAALDALGTAANTMTERVVEINERYEEAVLENDLKAMENFREEGRKITKQNLEAFKFAQDSLLGLMYERPIVPHEAPQENIQLAETIIELLEQGEVSQAVDEYVWMVNNVLEWYAMYFSPEVVDIQDDMMWGEDNADNLYWGTNKGFVKAQVEDATRSLMLRYDEAGGNFSEEIAIYQREIGAQQEVLMQLARNEIDAMLELAEMLKI